jgi:predicted SAM-dependent methyltransferase
MAQKRLLNLGCGNIYHRDWVNTDLFRSGKNVIAVDVKKSLPFQNNYFDAIYTSHLLEHLNVEESERLLNECYRVLKRDGVIRVAVPDLEQISKLYLDKLEKVSSGKKDEEINYDWMVLEMFDQTVRAKTGGKMLDYLLQPNLENKDFVLSRIGNEAQRIWGRQGIPTWKVYLDIVKKRGIGWLIKYIYMRALGVPILLAGGKDAYYAYNEGLFRLSGDIHKQMFDRYSLSRILKRAGFRNAKKLDAFTSKIKNFRNYNLDVLEGVVRKPDSLFMEASK